MTGRRGSRREGGDRKGKEGNERARGVSRGAGGEREGKGSIERGGEGGGEWILDGEGILRVEMGSRGERGDLEAVEGM